MISCFSFHGEAIRSLMCFSVILSYMFGVHRSANSVGETRWLMFCWETLTFMWRPVNTNQTPSQTRYTQRTSSRVTHTGGLTKTVSSIVTMATLWLPQVDATDATTARVLSDQHGRNVTLLEVLKTKQRGEIRALFGTDQTAGDHSHLQFEAFGAASIWRAAQATAHLPQKDKQRKKIRVQAITKRSRWSFHSCKILPN